MIDLNISPTVLIALIATGLIVGIFILVILAWWGFSAIFIAKRRREKRKEKERKIQEKILKKAASTAEIVARASTLNDNASSVVVVVPLPTISIDIYDEVKSRSRSVHKSKSDQTMDTSSKYLHYSNSAAAAPMQRSQSERRQTSSKQQQRQTSRSRSGSRRGRSGSNPVHPQQPDTIDVVVVDPTTTEEPLRKGRSQSRKHRSQLPLEFHTPAPVSTNKFYRSAGPGRIVDEEDFDENGRYVGKIFYEPSGTTRDRSNSASKKRTPSTKRRSSSRKRSTGAEDNNKDGVVGYRHSRKERTGSAPQQTTSHHIYSDTRQNILNWVQTVEEPDILPLPSDELMTDSNSSRGKSPKSPKGVSYDSYFVAMQQGGVPQSPLSPTHPAAAVTPAGTTPAAVPRYNEFVGAVPQITAAAALLPPPPAATFFESRQDQLAQIPPTPSSNSLISSYFASATAANPNKQHHLVQPTPPLSSTSHEHLTAPLSVSIPLANTSVPTTVTQHVTTVQQQNPPLAPQTFHHHSYVQHYYHHQPQQPQHQQQQQLQQQQPPLPPSAAAKIMLLPKSEHPQQPPPAPTPNNTLLVVPTTTNNTTLAPSSIASTIITTNNNNTFNNPNRFSMDGSTINRENAKSPTAESTVSSTGAWSFAPSMLPPGVSQQQLRPLQVQRDASGALVPSDTNKGMRRPRRSLIEAASAKMEQERLMQSAGEDGGEGEGAVVGMADNQIVSQEGDASNDNVVVDVVVVGGVVQGVGMMPSATTQQQQDQVLK